MSPNNLWDDNELLGPKEDLDLRVYTSRLLGRCKDLVLHGGGNTSVKILEKNIFGEEEEVLYVKGSGADLDSIDKSGFTPLSVEYLRKLSRLPSLSDPQMLKELLSHRLTPNAPPPSVESILHAILPYKYVDHTHADAIITLTNSVNGYNRVRDVFGDHVLVIEYIMPGFDLAKMCTERFEKEATPHTIGIVLMNHGVFSFGNNARQSYQRMIEIVSMAENYLKEKNAWDIWSSEDSAPSTLIGKEIVNLRRKISVQVGSPVILNRHSEPRSLSFSKRADLSMISQQGPATPEHVIRTKRLPLLGRDIEAYANAYRDYFQRYEPLAKERKRMLDPAPRVLIDSELGVITIGKTPKEASIVGDIYLHTMDIIERATALGGYKALDARDYFEMEYWDLEQAKLQKGGAPLVFAGEVVLITGAASGIGKACVESFLKRGAAVVGIDLNPTIETMYSDRKDFLGVQCDLSEIESFDSILERIVSRFGGLDILVLNAGIFPGGCRIENLKLEEWNKVMKINLTANLILMRDSFYCIENAPRGGRVVVVGSKNVPAPGVGAAAYSASKAALIQLMRVAALEWGVKGIRINAVNPNAVFDTGIWTDNVLAARAAHGGMTIEQYKTNNLLSQEVKSSEVAEVVAELAGPLFAKTTGAQIPIDGGNERVI